MRIKLLALLILAFQLLQGQSFIPGCTLPFENIKLKHPIDNTCPSKGTATLKNAKANANQNKAKNNFCAEGAVKEITVDKLIELYNKVEEAGISFGSSTSVPEDRTPLTNLGEGSQVSFTGYINRVDYSNQGKGESVNCKKGGKAFNDIHMELTENKLEEDICRRISAEISPHYRPKSWEVTNLKNIKENNMKIKITGQLFFDASHKACGGTSKGTRASSWEIHPVYRIQVFVNREWLDYDEVEWIEEEE